MENVLTIVLAVLLIVTGAVCAFSKPLRNMTAVALCLIGLVLLLKPLAAALS